MPDVYVFGDSHWRVFFPFTNHGPPLVHVEGDLRVHDTIGNSMSGATMYGLLNDSSSSHARQRVMNILRSVGGADHLALVFGEVDIRYHSARYFDSRGLIIPKVMELLARYRQFIDELYMGSLVRGKTVVYYGFAYARQTVATWDGGQYKNIRELNWAIEDMLPATVAFHGNIVPVMPRSKLIDEVGYLDRRYMLSQDQSPGEVHLGPDVYHDFTGPVLRSL